MKKISDIISVEDIESWKGQQNGIVFINSGTGTGKSYFIKNKLYNYCEQNGLKILMLVNRRLTKDQFDNDIRKKNKDKPNKTIDIMTYQNVSTNHKDKSFTDYDFIICDENHYFLTDASFNRTTDITYDKVMDCNVPKIMMSATGSMMNKIIEKTHSNNIIAKYTIEQNFDFIQDITYFNRHDDLDEILKGFIKSKTKAIVFVDSAKKAHELYQLNKKYSMFVCGENSYERKYVDKAKLNKLINNGKFDELFLITTTVLDSGFSIIDNNLSNIVVSVGDIDTAIQCIGRKRLSNKDDRVNIFIDMFDNNRLGGRASAINRKLEPARLLKRSGEEAFVKRYSRVDVYGGIIYDDLEELGDGQQIVRKRINNIMYAKHQLDLVNYKEIINMNKSREDKDGYAIMFNKSIDRDGEDIEQYISKKDIDFRSSVESLMKKLLGEKIYQGDKSREVLISTIGLRDNARNLCRGRNSINPYLREMRFPYSIQTERDNRRSVGDEVNENYRKTYWYIQEEEIE